MHQTERKTAGAQEFELESQASRVIQNEILYLQSQLVETLLSLDGSPISFEDISNFITQDPDGHLVPRSWYLVTPWLAEKLDGIGQPVLTDGHNHWWGRTCCGQMIIADGVMRSDDHRDRA